MKRIGWAACFICLGGLTWYGADSSAQAPDVGPGSGGAVLRNPLDPTPSKPMPKAGASYVETITRPTPATTAPAPFPELIPTNPEGGRAKGLAALKPSEKDDINRDIAVTPAQGPWLISVMSYVGPEAPEMAREFALEMRTTYKMQAFVFNHGAEERRKEYERVKAIIDQQKKYCEAENLPLDKVRIRYTYVQDQCAVLIGGFASEEAARREKERIKNLKPPDPKKVKLDQGYQARYDLIGDKSALTPAHWHPDKREGVPNPNFKGYKPPEQAKDFTHAPINPFKRAFIVPNPAMKTDRKAEREPHDMATLKKLNRGEPFNLLECKKPVTIAISQFHTPTALEDSPSAKTGGFLGIGAKKKMQEDHAAAQANSLAKNLRDHFKLDVYVLHTRYSSVVCVGGFDSADDPNFRSMKSLLQSRLRIPGIPMLPEPYPMMVPR